MPVAGDSAMIPPPALAPRDYMSALYDFLPVLAFFIAFKYAGIYLGTKVLMGATALQLLAKWLHTRVLSKMMVYSCVLVFVFGGATLYFHNDLVIMWMPTVLYVTLAVAFIRCARLESCISWHSAQSCCSVPLCLAILAMSSGS